MTAPAPDTPEPTPAASAQRSSGPVGARPTRRRMVGLDAARALAIIGMLAVNVGPELNDGVAGLIYELPRGRASLLFMILAGVGISLMTRAARIDGAPLPWRTLLWRAVLLLSLGLALQLLDHEVSVILACYGVLFLLGPPLARAPRWLLIAGTAVMLILGPTLWILAQVWTGVTFEFNPASLTDGPGPILHEILLSGAYPVIVWVVPFLFGMVLGQLDLSRARVQWALIGGGATAAVLGFLASWLLIGMLGEPGEDPGLDRLVSAVDHSQMPLWLISGSGSAVAVMGLCLRLEEPLRRWGSALVSAGRLSLTLYVAHLVVLAVLVRPGPDTLAGGYAVTLIMSIGLILGAHLWWCRWGVGPLERLLTWPPLRRR
ncbi:MAG: acyltransferase family protein [Micrococcaceae bacterium]